MDQQNERLSVRVPKVLEIEYAADGPPVKAQTRDISEGGVSVDTAHPPNVGTVVELKIVLRDALAGQTIEGQGRVRWRREAEGMGIEFQGLPDSDRDRIKFFVTSESFAAGTIRA